MEQFNLEKWLQDKSRKIVTRNNKPVRIVCWDKLGDYPIICCIKYSDDYEDLESYDSNGYKYSPLREDQNDLFFADKEEELTEFEKAIYQHICIIVTACDGNVYGDKELKPIVKGIAKELLDLARKELKNNDWRQSLMSYKDAYEQGKQDALKDLPKWKKVTKILSENPFLAFYPSDDHRNLCVNGFEINIHELFETLPKEE